MKRKEKEMKQKAGIRGKNTRSGNRSISVSPRALIHTHIRTHTHIHIHADYRNHRGKSWCCWSNDHQYLISLLLCRTMLYKDTIARHTRLPTATGHDKCAAWLHMCVHLHIRACLRMGVGVLCIYVCMRVYAVSDRPQYSMLHPPHPTM